MLTLGNHDDTEHGRKSSKSVRVSEFPLADTSWEGNGADNDLLTLLGYGVDDEDVGVHHFEYSVNEEVERFQKELLKKKDFPKLLHLHELHRAVRDRPPGLPRVD